jgi:predicted O-methyltransferase YrrM
MRQLTPWLARLQGGLGTPLQHWWWRELLANLRAIVIHHPHQSALLARTWLAMALQALSRHTNRRPFTVPVASFGQDMKIAVTDLSEVFTLLEVFALDAYELPFKKPVRTIVDAGAHIGSSALWFASRYPNARIIAIEPHPATFTFLHENIKNILMSNS